MKKRKKRRAHINGEPLAVLRQGVPVRGGRRATFPRSPAVSSPRRGLTSLFGMGRGAPPRHSRRSCLEAALPGGRGTARARRRTRRRGHRATRRTERPAGARLEGRRGAPPHGRELYGPLVPLGSTSRNAPTCGLSTSSSATALKGGLISGRASRLDAFSAYPLRTRLPGCAPGGTTGTP